MPVCDSHQGGNSHLLFYVLGKIPLYYIEITVYLLIGAKEGTSTSNPSSEDYWCHCQDHISNCLCCLSHLLFHTLQRILVRVVVNKTSVHEVLPFHTLSHNGIIYKLASYTTACRMYSHSQIVNTVHFIRINQSVEDSVKSVIFSYNNTVWSSFLIGHC